MKLGPCLEILEFCSMFKLFLFTIICPFGEKKCECFLDGKNIGGFFGVGSLILNLLK